MPEFFIEMPYLPLGTGMPSCLQIFLTMSGQISACRGTVELLPV